MRKFSVACVLAAVVLMAGPVLAQTSEYTTSSYIGVMGNVGIPVFRGIQVVGDVGINHKNDSGAGINFGTITGGARYVFPVKSAGTIKPFVEGLVGVGILNVPDYGTHKGVAWGVGAGVDVMALRWAGVRAQINYFRTQLENNGPTLEQVRFSIGLCLGRKVKVAGGWAPSHLKATNIISD